MKRFGNALCALAAGLAGRDLPRISAPCAGAQTWPQRSVRFIVSLGPGSGADIGARLLADQLTREMEAAGRGGEPAGRRRRRRHQRLHRRQGRPHAALYADLVVHGASVPAWPRCPTIRPSSARSRRISNTLVGLGRYRRRSKINSVKDLIAQIKAQPGKLNFSTATGMTDFIFDGYFKSAGLDITRVPYRDVVAPLTDLGEGPHPGLCRSACDRAAACPGRPGQADRRHQQPARARRCRIRPTVAQAGFPDTDLRRPHRVVRAARHAGCRCATGSPPTSKR